MVTVVKRLFRLSVSLVSERKVLRIDHDICYRSEILILLVRYGTHHEIFVGLYYGAWISQKLVRDINNGEYLLRNVPVNDRRNSTKTLSVLRFTYDEWDWKNSPEPQFRNYCRWMKRSLLRGHPVMFVAYLLYMKDEIYDHIMPAIGIKFNVEDEYDPEDVLIYFNLYHDKKIERKMSENELAATRKTCRKHCGDGGCIPLNVSEKGSFSLNQTMKLYLSRSTMGSLSRVFWMKIM